jgi:hypothetical protein
LRSSRITKSQPAANVGLREDFSLSGLSPPTKDKTPVQDGQWIPTDTGHRTNIKWHQAAERPFSRDANTPCLRCCGAKSFGPEAEQIMDEAFQREYDRLP